MKRIIFIILMMTTIPGRAQTGNNELVKVNEMIPGIVIDLKYNTLDNFTGQKLYTTNECFLARIVVERLMIVQDSLNKIREHDGVQYPEGLGLKIWDGYRPRAIQYLMWEILPDPTYVANPSTGSSHNRGAAVDLTLVDLATGEELQMPTYFDDFSEQAWHTYTDLPENVLANRELLKNMMIGVGGFALYNAEWWHYSYGAATGYPLLDFQMK